jgi:hypothetical protein
VPLSVLPDIARKAAEDTANLIIEAGCLVPGTSRRRRPAPNTAAPSRRQLPRAIRPSG